MTLAEIIAALRINCKHFHYLLLYWLFEAAMLIVWLSCGIGIAHAGSILSEAIARRRLGNTIETNITLYTLAFGVILQTNIQLIFLEDLLIRIKKKAPVLYFFVKTLPLWTLIVVSYYEILIQFKLRYTQKPIEAQITEVESERMATFKFLLALSFFGYCLGRKCRMDLRLDELRSRAPFECPGIIKYCFMFAFLYIMEVVLLVLLGLPLVLLGIFYRYYPINEYLAYLSLNLLGILLGYASIFLRFENDDGGHILFSDEGAYSMIHGEVRNNFFLFTLVPFAARWYFRVQIPFPDLKTSIKVNFLLFAVNTSLILLYFVKFTLIYCMKTDSERLRGRRRRGRRVNPEELIFNYGNANNNGLGSPMQSYSTVTTGTFSGGNVSLVEEPLFSNLNNVRKISLGRTFQRNMVGPTLSTPTMNSFDPNSNQDGPVNKYSFQDLDALRKIPSRRKYKDLKMLRCSKVQGSKELGNVENENRPLEDVDVENNHENSESDSEGLLLPLSPLTSSFGIMKVKGTWKDHLIPGANNRIPDEPYIPNICPSCTNNHNEPASAQLNTLISSTSTNVNTNNDESSSCNETSKGMSSVVK